MPSSAPATTTEATTCTENGAPSAAATAPANAPPANIEKTKSTLAASTAPRTRASPNHDSQLLSLNHDMPFLSHASICQYRSGHWDARGGDGTPRSILSAARADHR